MNGELVFWRIVAGLALGALVGTSLVVCDSIKEISNSLERIAISLEKK